MTLLRRMTGRPTKDGSGEKTNAVMCTWGLGEGGDRGSGPQMHARSLQGLCSRCSSGLFPSSIHSGLPVTHHFKVRFKSQSGKGFMWPRVFLKGYWLLLKEK